MLNRYKINFFVLSINIVIYLLIAFPAQSQLGTSEMSEGPEIAPISDENISNESFLPPRMNTNERNEIYPIEKGLVIYNTDSTCLEIFDGTAWYDLCSGNSYTPAAYSVTNPTTGRSWMDRNLGASQVSTSSDDYLSYGDLYQWGRSTDGHQEIIWNSTSSGTPANGSTASISNSDICPDALFVYTLNSDPRDWRSPQNENLWQGSTGINNPCPNGYRLPTDLELSNEHQSWSSSNASGAFDSPLKFTVPGWRSYFDGTLGMTGSMGIYWSSTVEGSNARYLEIGKSHANLNATFRAFGLSVRCIKD